MSTRQLRSLSLVVTSLCAITLVVACSDDPANPSAPAADASAPVDAGADAPATSDAATDSSVPDASTDAPPAGAIPDGKFVLETWTCTKGDGGIIDVKAFALSLQIQGVAQTTTGTTGSVEVTYPNGCLRTVPIKSITYPSPGMVTSTAGGNRTCTVSCPANQCTPGVEPDLTDTYAFTYSAPTLTFTQTFTTHPSLQAAATCATGDLETVVYKKQ